MTNSAQAAQPAAGVREFKMPDVGEGLTEAEILKWYVQPGDTVTDGQVVCEVETAKAAVELPIPFDGVVHDLRFDEGTTVDVGTPIIAVDTGGPAAGSGGGDASAAQAAMETGAGAAAEVAEEAAVTEGAQPEGTQQEEAGAEGEGRQPVLVGYGVATSSTKRRPRKPAPGQGSAAGGAATEPAPATEPVPAAEPVPGDNASEVDGAPGVNGHGEPSSVAGSRPLAKPPVRKLAKDLGVDLAAVAPSGPDGIVTREDVHAAAARAAAPAAPAAAREPVEPAAFPAEPSASAAAARETRIPVKGVRKATAQAMVDSAFTAPHVTEFVTVDVTRTMKLVADLKQDPDMAGVRINPLLLVAKAFLVAIRRHPEVNASWDEERQEIVRKHYVNLGIAAATPRGLIVPNIKDAHDKTLPELASALGELVATAREGRTSPAAMSGGTVTITNVGVFGVDTGTPILNPGESAILAFGQVREQPWVHKGKVKPRHVTTLALSFDHRLVDGELGSKVLADIAAVLEHPKRLMLWQ
ncbi:dihydrolipoamide acetyltransferase family protein [Streptomyces reniochalinae]|uniref:Dihydrolipoamide acetyltransferase component of pyruvate dehydrogenase complex n=1 Tax=Streptomyces reniochalinae TaxID=2250578 RepID=A0A367EHP3_9ACTN|nr:dihydrolipoamide acetyltransferase family protein [Streptomyces reniochalinae]RCG17155.1 2-oxo acid dehydrogenase subunit E2 [Streptomyces reniochalinae]